MAPEPGERSLFRKMQVVLERVRPGRCASEEEIVEAILEDSPSCFRYERTDSSTGRRRRLPSRESIRRAVQMCGELALVDLGTGRLTRTGMTAASRGRFAAVVGQQVVARLAELEIPVQHIERAITKLLGARSPVLSTAPDIFLALGAPIPEHQFRTYLTLLGQCGVLRASQRKAYLPA
jgi:hypothetical protein